ARRGALETPYVPGAQAAEQPTDGAPQAQFGGRPMGCDSSANFAIERIIGSENLGPTICSPTGSLAAVSPAGTLAAGSAASDTRNVGPIQSRSEERRVGKRATRRGRRSR